MTATQPVGQLDVLDDVAVPWRTVQRLVLPRQTEQHLLALYAEPGRTEAGADAPVADGLEVDEHRRLRVPARSTASFATYFNAFPAAHWQRSTDVARLRLEVRLSGAARVTVHRSDASGVASFVISAAAEADGALTDGPTVSVDLPLNGFDEGGWFWFDVTAADGDVAVENAQWLALLPVETGRGGVSIGVTTFNRAAQAAELMRRLGDDPAVLAVVDRVYLVDQGTQKVRDEEGFAAVADRLGDRLRLLDQANVGGSGGFARSMLETLDAGISDYVLLLDDDVALEPESILRAHAFAQACRVPTIVGGHMLNLLSPTRLHSFGETVRGRPFDWGPADGVREDHDFATAGLRRTPWLHRRVDVDYNGWWMCLIPVEVLRSVGLSLPFFLKWDDAEYGLRAGEAGHPTVSLPGVAIWHMPWTHKDELLEWQGYFYERNRVVTALLHPRGSQAWRIVLDDFVGQLRHLVSMQYSAVDLRVRAVHDILAGPEQLHLDLATKLPEIRAVRGSYSDAQATTDLRGFSHIAEIPLGKHEDLRTPTGPGGKLRTASAGILRQVLPNATAEDGTAQSLVPPHHTYWWRMALLDSALVPTNDRTAVRYYRRDRRTFLRLLGQSTRASVRLLRQWPELRQRYGQALPAVTSADSWRQTLTDLPGAAGPTSAPRGAAPR